MADKREKLEILLKHLIGHNKDHAAEIKGLAETAKELGMEEASELLLKGMKEMDASNATLSIALDKIAKEN